MEILHLFLVFFHILGAAALVGGWLASFKTPTIGTWQHVGAWVQLVTGLGLTAVAEMDPSGGPVNHAKIGVKLVLLIAVLVAAIVGRRKVKNGDPVPTGVAHTVGGFSLINVALAVFW